MSPTSEDDREPGEQGRPKDVSPWEGLGGCEKSRVGQKEGRLRKGWLTPLRWGRGKAHVPHGGSFPTTARPRRLVHNDSGYGQHEHAIKYIGASIIGRLRHVKRKCAHCSEKPRGWQWTVDQRSRPGRWRRAGTHAAGTETLPPRHRDTCGCSAGNPATRAGQIATTAAIPQTPSPRPMPVRQGMPMRGCRGAHRRLEAAR